MISQTACLLDGKWEQRWVKALCAPLWHRIKTIFTNCDMATALYEGQEILPITEFLIFSFLCGMKKQNPEHDLRYLWMLLLSQWLVPFIQGLVPSIQAGKQSTLAASLWVNNLTPLLNCWSQIGILQGSKYLTAFFGKKEKKPHLFPLSWNLNSSWGHLKQGPQHFARMMSPSAHPTCWAHLTQTSF